ELDPRNVASIESAAELRFESQGSAFPVTVSRLSPIVETDSRIQRGRFRFVEATAPIGASGEVVWRDAAGLLPITLIVQRDQQLGVFVADGQKARFMALPMAQEGRPARANLPPDTLLVVRGQSRLQDGDELSFSRP
ncbi:MAG: efflux RND transporter periplasmic adaptor subunit, partial [Woeseia sp.]|nr:efflux RND transporter periplasmic adaptor subunit [Woeseia sp.]